MELHLAKKHNKYVAVQLNIKQCEKIGKILEGLKFRRSFFEREFFSFKKDKETKARIYLYACAICHQTHGLKNKKKNLIGFDYLEYVFLNLAKNNSELLDPKYIASLKTGELINKLKPLFAEDGNLKNCTLTRLRERAGFLIDIANKLNKYYDGRITNLIKSSDGFLVKNGRGLYELLGKFKAFSDPMKKKSTLFIEFICDTDIVKIKDPENFIPIMDYHMQRVFLRTGCVEVLDKKLKEALLNKKPVNSDIEIRSACIEVAKLLSKFSGYSVLRINDFLWPLGRSCCKETMLCVDRRCSKNPCTFYLAVDLKKHKECVFEGVCRGSLDREYRKYWQPIVNTHYY